jgi:hypothetical protein
MTERRYVSTTGRPLCYDGRRGSRVGEDARRGHSRSLPGQLRPKILDPCSAALERLSCLTSLIFLFLLPTKRPGFSGPCPRTRSLRRVYTEEVPTLDGLVDEEAWANSLPAQPFLQKEPQAGADASEPTIVLALYTNASLYLGSICSDSSGRMGNDTLIVALRKIE